MWRAVPISFIELVEEIFCCYLVSALQMSKVTLTVEFKNIFRPILTVKIEWLAEVVFFSYGTIS